MGSFDGVFDRARGRTCTPSWAALMSSQNGGRKPQLPAGQRLIARAHFVSDFFVRLVRLAASGRARGRGTSSAAIAPAGSASSPASPVGGAELASTGGGSRTSHWQSL